jgi:hypothetical protein
VAAEHIGPDVSHELVKRRRWGRRDVLDVVDELRGRGRDRHVGGGGRGFDVGAHV